MIRRHLPIVLAAATTLLAQYNDYPTGEYEFSHDRVVISPLKLVGGMDPAKRDEGPKVNLSWTPNIDILDIRYEHIVGVDGTLGFGPIFTYYPALDSVKATIWAAGIYGRYYMGLGHGPYVQFSAQWYDQTDTKVHNGSGTDTGGQALSKYTLSVSGPQISPVLGYCTIVGAHLVLEAQMGFTFGSYTTTVDNGQAVTTSLYGDKVYKSGTNWGGFYFAQVAIGVAW